MAESVLPYVHEGRLTNDQVTDLRQQAQWLDHKPVSGLSDTRRALLHELINTRSETGVVPTGLLDKQARKASLPELEPPLRGLDQDHEAAVASLKGTNLDRSY